MKQKIIGGSVVVLLILGTSLTFQNCSRTLFGVSGFRSSEYSSLSSSEENVIANPYALLSAEQVFKSMSSVTGVQLQPNGAIATEYNNRQSVFAGGFSLGLATSPMMIGITNLSGAFCNEMVNQEIAVPAAQRRFFASVDFAKASSQVSEATFLESLSKMSFAFWGRGLEEEEVQILGTGRSEFVTGLTDAEKAQSSSSKNLFIFTCSAMLSSFDSMSF